MSESTAGEDFGSVTTSARLSFRNCHGELTDGLCVADQREIREAPVWGGGTQRASALHPVDAPPPQRPSADMDKEYLLGARVDVVRHQ